MTTENLLAAIDAYLTLANGYLTPWLPLNAPLRAAGQALADAVMAARAASAQERASEALEVQSTPPPSDRTDAGSRPTGRDSEAPWQRWASAERAAVDAHLEARRQEVGEAAAYLRRWKEGAE